MANQTGRAQTEPIATAAQLIARSRRLVVFTGAGVSKESGVPTFRDALDGLWAHYNPEQLATPQAFKANPGLVWRWYAERHTLIESVKPNAAHLALFELEMLLPQVLIVTQNIDGLHRRAGSSDVIALHGDIREYKCVADCQGNPTLIDVPNWSQFTAPPPCPYCGRLVRPNVVWFGEALPLNAFERASDFCQVSDVLLVIGTSGLVNPAAMLPRLGKDAGAALIDINLAHDEISKIADIFIQAPAGQTLPLIVQLIRALN